MKTVNCFLAVLSTMTSAMAQSEPRTANDAVSRSEVEAMRAEIESLRATVASLQQDNSEKWLTERRAEEIRMIVADVLADADTRASLLDAPALAGHDGNHFFLQDADGDFRLEFSGQLQVRYVYNRQNDSEDRTRAGAEVQRARLKFDGQIYDDFEFSVTGGFDRNTGSFDIVDATIGYDFTDEFSMTAGRFRSPFLREEDVSSKRQLMVERSLVEKALGQDRTLGIAFKYEVNDRFEVRGSLMDGSEGFTDQSEKWQASSRADLLLAGKWKQFDDFTSQPADPFGALVGGGILYINDPDPEPGFDEYTDLRWTIDFSAEMNGINFFTALIGSHLAIDGGQSSDRYGVVAQGGVYLVDDWEFVGRFEWGTDPDEPPDLLLFTIGLNKYIHGHDVKFTVDAGYGFNAVSDFWNSTSAGWRQDTGPDSDGQFVVRTQLQLLF